jgi:hypothetical protein
MAATGGVVDVVVADDVPAAVGAGGGADDVTVGAGEALVIVVIAVDELGPVDRSPAPTHAAVIDPTTPRSTPTATDGASSRRSILLDPLMTRAYR